MILGIFSVLPISIAVLVVAAVVWFSNKRLFAKIDYRLLLTFLLLLLDRSGIFKTYLWSPITFDRTFFKKRIAL